jgi:hypothetical protein
MPTNLSAARCAMPISADKPCFDANSVDPLGLSAMAGQA